MLGFRNILLLFSCSCFIVSYSPCRDGALLSLWMPRRVALGKFLLLPVLALSPLSTLSLGQSQALSFTSQAGGSLDMFILKGDPSENRLEALCISWWALL